WYKGEEYCPVIGVSGRNRLLLFGSVGRIVPYHWCQWEEWCFIVGVSGRYGAPLLMSLEE
ncbi:unnamed protein product, partial [Staurois parvus]